jgi:hypothetical protein
MTSRDTRAVKQSALAWPTSITSAVAASLNANDARAVFGILIGDALDQPSEHLLDLMVDVPPS